MSGQSLQSLSSKPIKSSSVEPLSSPTSSVEDEPSGSTNKQTWGSSSHQSQLTSPQTPTSPGANRSNSIPGASLKSMNPMQKRRRVTRACDTCRSKKIKCDGKQPCTHCTVYSYDCTYDQPSNRRRNPAPQYIEALENKLQRMETLLKIVLPDVDINNPDLDMEKLAELKQRYEKTATPNQHQHPPAEQSNQGSGGSGGSGGGGGGGGGGGSGDTGQNQPNKSGHRQDALLETMVEAAGRLDIDERGHVDFHGHSSGFTFLQKLREEFGDLLGQDVGSSTFLRLRAPQLVTGALESPRSTNDSPRDAYSNDQIALPARAIAQDLVNYCLNEACIFFRFIHRPSFDEMFSRIYDMDMEEYGTREYRFLPILYLSLAVGCVFTPEPEKYGFTDGTAEGTKYFLAGRRLVEITDCRDIASIQCVILMILFLQSSAKLATCYSFVSIALSASVRMGMHRKFAISNPIEAELRKRIFWTIRKMDIYVGTLLGLPRAIQDEDIDQEYPMEIDDEYITKDGILPAPEGAQSSIAAANAHTKLLKILAKIVKYIYPIKGLQLSGSGKRSGYMVTYTAIREIEEELEKWHDNLPMFLKPGDDAPVRFTRSQHLLKMSFAHTKMMLYRPFLLHVAKSREGQVSDQRPWACGAACVNVCREIVSIAKTMREKNILNGAYWFNIYTAFFSTISLVYFVLENVSHPDAPEILREATIGKDCLMSLKGKSMAAERCSTTLKGLFEQLPNRLKSGFENASVNKKRARGVSPGINFTPPNRELSPFPSISAPSISATPKNFPSTPENAGGDSKMTDRPDSLSNFEIPETHYDVGSSSESNGVGKLSNGNTSFQQHLGAAGGMPDLNALMFPSSEVFEFASTSPVDNSYKPLTAAERNGPACGGFGTPAGARQSSQAAQEASIFPSLEAQLFGPYQPYFYQGQMGSADMATSPIVEQNAMLGMPDFSGYQNPAQPKLSAYPMNLDEMFCSGMEESTDWENFVSKTPFHPQ